MNQKAEEFLRSLKGKKVAVCGVGHNNIPVLRQMVKAGALVTACDRRDRAAVGSIVEELESQGVTFQLGDSYLSGLDQMDLVLRTPGMKPYLPELEEARRNGVTVTSEMELFFSLCPAKIYAVTGSDGKTTTTTIISELLKHAGYKVHVGGNIGRPLLPEIQQIMPEDKAVVELSSFQLTGMQQSPSVGVVTNVAPNHLDWHKDMQEYVDAKKNMISHQTSDDRAVLNADNAVTAGFGKLSQGTTVWFSRRHPVEHGAWMDKDGTLYYQDGDAKTAVMNASDILIPGLHNVENYLAAICAVWGTVKPDEIRDFARTFGGVEHRCELVRTLHGVKWYNDSIGSSPSRTIAGLVAFDRKVILIAGGYDKHIPYEPLGIVAKDTVKSAILMGATGDKIEAAIRKESNLPIVRVANMEEAVAKAAELAKDGDIVFMSPASASFDLYPNFEVRGQHFKRLVNELKA